jgi:MFS family permease
LQAPYFARVYASGWIFSIVRWGLSFLGTFVVNDLTGSPRLVQLAGAFMWAPLLFAGLLGGAISDRFDRRRTVLWLFAAMVPLTLGMGWLGLAGRLDVWVVTPFMTLIGIGWVIDMTARRALVYDLVGPEQIDNALALEMFSTASGLALGSLVGGSLIEWLGVGSAYLAIAGLVAIAALCMWSVPSVEGTHTPAAEPFLRALTSGFRALPQNLTLVSILGVTVIVDFFCFSYAPLIQVVGVRLGATPVGIGLLATSTGVGMMFGSLWVAAAQPHRGHAYLAGSVIAMGFLFGFVLFDSYGWVLASLFASSVGFGLFGATQGALTITAADAAMRGRAMGLLSMAIGSLPFGMYALGELAERIGVTAAVVAFNVAGLVLLTAWIVLRPETRHAA